MKQKVIKQNISLVVDLKLKEVLTHLAGAKRLTLSQYCAKILNDYVDAKGMGKSFTDIEAENVKPVFTESPEQIEKLKRLGDEVDELADMLPDLPK